MAKQKGIHSEFENAEAMGDVKTLPFDDEPELMEAEEVIIASKPMEFQMAIGHAQMEGTEYIEVTPELFNFLVRKAKTKYLTYGDPGIKVYKVGTRDDLQREESMSAEQYHEHIMKKRMVEHAK